MLMLMTAMMIMTMMVMLQAALEISFVRQAAYVIIDSLSI